MSRRRPLRLRADAPVHGPPEPARYDDPHAPGTGEEATIRVDPPRWAIPYFALCFLAQIWPLASAANRIEPRILGLPFFLFWYVLWVLLIFVGVLLLYRGSLGDRAEGQEALSDPKGNAERSGGAP